MLSLIVGVVDEDETEELDGAADEELDCAADEDTTALDVASLDELADTDELEIST